VCLALVVYVSVPVCVCVCIAHSQECVSLPGWGCLSQKKPGSIKIAFYGVVSLTRVDALKQMEGSCN